MVWMDAIVLPAKAAPASNGNECISPGGGGSWCSCWLVLTVRVARLGASRLAYDDSSEIIVARLDKCP